MKDFSKETINIAGKDYTLFLNRKGIVAWEKYAKEENSKLAEMSTKYDDLLEEVIEINDDTDPFENIDGIEEDANIVSKSYRKLYWIMLYENHKLSLKEVNELYDKAVEEYGEEQIFALAQQMIKEANIDKMGESNKEIKKLPALKPRQ